MPCRSDPELGRDRSALRTARDSEVPRRSPGGTVPRRHLRRTPLGAEHMLDGARITYGALARALPASRRYLARSPGASRTWSERLGMDLAEESSLPRMLLNVALRRNVAGPVLFTTTRPERRTGGCRGGNPKHEAVGCPSDGIQRLCRRSQARLPRDDRDVMIEDFGSLSGDIGVEAELAVVGSGPAGIVVALEAARHGISVVLLESGNRSFDPAVQELSEAAEWNCHRHAPLSLAVRRQVGGTSVIWGGRCVPFDPVDFASRPFLAAPAWPIELQRSRKLLPAGM